MAKTIFWGLESQTRPHPWKFPWKIPGKISKFPILPLRGEFKLITYDKGKLRQNSADPQLKWHLQIKAEYTVRVVSSTMTSIEATTIACGSKHDRFNNKTINAFSRLRMAGHRCDAWLSGRFILWICRWRRIRLASPHHREHYTDPKYLQLQGCSHAKRKF